MTSRAVEATALQEALRQVSDRLSLAGLTQATNLVEQAHDIVAEERERLSTFEEEARLEAAVERALIREYERMEEEQWRYLSESA